MLYNQPIKQLHFEITNNCNSSCPMCPRNIHGGPQNPVLPLSELSIEDIKLFCPPPLLQSIEHIYFAGAYGDPMMAADLLEVVSYLKDCNENLGVGVFTNGSAHHANWWDKLGSLLSGDKDYCIFSIDGLGSTNHIYRRGTSWTKIMESAKSYIKAGGIAHWEFLVFKHNEHQVEEAKNLATELGFKKFTEKYTGRFGRNSSNNSTLGWHNAHPVYRSDGSFDYLIEPASKVFNRQENWTDTDIGEVFSPKIKVSRKGIPLNNLLDEYVDNSDSEVSCKARNESKVYISATGLAFPCPWLAYHLYRYDETTEGYIVKQLFSEEVLSELDIRKNSLDQIINSSVYKKIPLLWSRKSIEEGKLPTCIGECGKKCSLSRSLKNQSEFVIN